MSKRSWLKRIAGWTAIVIVVAVAATFAVAWFKSGNTCARRSGVLLRPMNAIVYCDYGPPDVVRLEQLEKPLPESDELLVKVHAASVNPLEWHYVEGKPYILRLFNGLRQPDDIRLGSDYAGTVEAVGSKVTRFKPGDEVFGAHDGALAEYVTVREERGVVLKASNVTFEQAAAVPVAGVTALQALRDHGKIRPGQQVLINGASGGVGTFAVQLAKNFGATVTAVTSAKNVDLVRSLGANRVVDYGRDDYASGSTRYDIILDCVGNRTLADNRRVLADRGIYISIGGGGPNDDGWIGPLARPLAEVLLSPFVKQTLITFEAQIIKSDLGLLAELQESGKLSSVIDRRFSLAETKAALRYLEAGHARGKVIVTVAD